MSSSERIAKNTLYQYTQLILSVLVGLYSVRLILNALGTSDYGIFGLVSGIVTMTSFISSSLSQTSIRFIAVSLGQGGENTKFVFSNCFWLHFSFAVVLYILLQAIGYLLIFHFLNIPVERIDATYIAFQFILISLFINVSITPFQALIISHEKFIFIAIVSILISVLKLVTALIISSASYDRLILYCLLLALINLFQIIAYSLYCNHNYRKHISYKSFSKTQSKTIVGFAGWTILDVLGTTLTRDGYSVILNKFFGTSINAVFSLARQIEGQLYSLSASATNTIIPLIMKKEGAGSRDSMLSISVTTGKIGYFLISIVAIPLIIMSPDILQLWLSNVPQGTVLFTRLLIIACMANQLTSGLTYANQAIGDIKWFSIIVSSFRMIALPISWALFYFYGAPPHVAIVVFVICETLGSISRAFIISRQVDISLTSLIYSIFIKMIPATLASVAICMVIYPLMNNSFINILFVGIVNAIVYSLLSYLFTLSKSERGLVARLGEKILKRKRQPLWTE